MVEPQKKTLAYELWSIDNIDISNLERDAQQRNCFRRWYEKNGLVHRVIDGDTTFSHEYSAKLDEIMSGSVWYGYDIADDYKNKIDDELVEGGWKNITRGPSMVEMMRRLKNSMNFSSVVMIILTIILVIFTGVLIWQGLK